MVSLFLVVSPNVKMKDGFITSVVFDNLALTLILGVSPARDSRRASDHFEKMGECLHHSSHHAPCHLSFLFILPIVIHYHYFETMVECFHHSSHRDGRRIFSSTIQKKGSTFSLVR